MSIIKTITLKHISGAVVLIAFLSGHLLLMYVAIPEPNKEAVYHMQGILDAAVIAIISYYFGSSAGSKQKSEALEDALKTSQDQNK